MFLGRSESRKSDKDYPFSLNRALSVRSNKKDGSSTSTRQKFSFKSLRGVTQPELSKKLFKLIKSENGLIQCHESAGKERVSIASQLSEWGEATTDDAVSDISDKIGVLLAEIGEQEDLYAHNLDDSRGVLKEIRNTEKSVQPSRDNKAKLSDEIAKLKYKEPESTKLVTMEQELVRAEAENLVAEAQLTNITRQKLKVAYDVEFAAIIERAEKQIILARHGRRLLNLLNDEPVVPGDVRPAYENGSHARQVLNDAEDDLRDWRAELEEVIPNGPLHPNGTALHTAATTEEEPSVDNVLSTSHHQGQGEHLQSAVTTETPASPQAHEAPVATQAA